MKPSILFFVPTTYKALKEKGVENMILERDENGFFEKVITLHPFSNKTYSINLNEYHEVHEIGFDLIPGGLENRLSLYLQIPVHFFRVIWSAFRLIKKYRISMIRTVDPYWMGLFGYICSRICKIPFCVSIHADYEKRMELNKNISTIKVFKSYALAKRLEHFILSKANLVMPIRDTLAKKAIESKVSKEKIRVIPHGIDLKYFNRPPLHNIRQLFNISPNSKIISFVGRITKENYVDDAIKIGKILSEKRSDFVIIIAGGGVEERRIKEEIASNPSLKTHFLLTGFQPREVCLDLRRSSDVSLCLMAGFSLIEACAAGCPVISYDVEWHSELVKNKKTGFLLKENDVDGVVDALDWVLEHPDERNIMGQKAKTLAFENHDLKTTSDIKVKCYTEILSQGDDH